MSGKDLESIPKCILDLHDIELLDLSVNNLQRLPSDLWKMPLRTLNLSYNQRLGRVLVSVFKGAAQCLSLEELHLRAVVAKDIVVSSLPKLAPILRTLQKLKLLDIRDNGFPVSLAAQLRRELTMCRVRIVTCPGLHEGQKSLHLDEVVANQSAELDFSG